MSAVVMNVGPTGPAGPAGPPGPAGPSSDAPFGTKLFELASPTTLAPNAVITFYSIPMIPSESFAFHVFTHAETNPGEGSTIGYVIEVVGGARRGFVGNAIVSAYYDNNVEGDASADAPVVAAGSDVHFQFKAPITTGVTLTKFIVYRDG